METFKESDAGYPEEAPPEVVPDDAGPPDNSAARENARPDPAQKAETGGMSIDDGTATGNPDNAGSRM